MATLSITIPTAILARTIDAVSIKYGYQAILPDGTANQQTKQEFVRQWIITQLKNAVREQEGNTAAANAYKTASSDVDTNLNIT